MSVVSGLAMEEDQRFTNRAVPNVVPLLVARMTYTPFAKPETSMLVWNASSALIDVDKAILPVASTMENVTDPFIGLAEVICTEL